MNNIITQALTDIYALNENVPSGKHIVTADIRKLSAKLYRNIEDKNIDNIFSLCETLLEQRKWETGVIAYDWAYRVREQYNDNTYEVFYSWLKKYVRWWGDCDDFCTHAFGTLLRKQKELFPYVHGLTKDTDFWVRRASAIILIPSILHDDYNGICPYKISDELMNDEHDLVLKGYGWMLKCLSLKEPESVKKYLIEKHTVMPRVAFRYAMEKYDDKTRRELLSL